MKIAVVVIVVVAALVYEVAGDRRSLRVDRSHGGGDAGGHVDIQGGRHGGRRGNVGGAYHGPVGGHSLSQADAKSQASSQTHGGHSSSQASASASAFSQSGGRR